VLRERRLQATNADANSARGLHHRDRLGTVGLEVLGGLANVSRLSSMDG
jgi:hypothetical protein